MNNRLSSIIRQDDAASSVEFALVLPLLILFLFGIIDVGRYMWLLNRVEKATQMGARMAVVTGMVPTDLASANFGFTLGQGAQIPKSSFGSMQCSSNGTTASCSCVLNCSGIGTTADNANFNRVADRMTLISGVVGRSKVQITYTNSGLGYAGDPTGPDVAPIVTVSAVGVGFQSLLGRFFGINLTLPTVSSSLTLEDGQGNASN